MVASESNPLDEALAPEDDQEVQHIRLRIPSDMQALPSTSAGNRELVGKMRTRDGRPRASSTDPGYARSAAARERSRWQDRASRAPSAPKANSENASLLPLNRHAERGTDGKFAKKPSVTQKTKNAKAEEKSEEDAQS